MSPSRDWNLGSLIDTHCGRRSQTPNMDRVDEDSFVELNDDVQDDDDDMAADYIASS